MGGLGTGLGTVLRRRRTRGHSGTRGTRGAMCVHADVQDVNHHMYRKYYKKLLQKKTGRCVRFVWQVDTPLSLRLVRNAA